MKETFFYIVLLITLILIIPLFALMFDKKEQVQHPKNEDKPYLISVYNVKESKVEYMELEKYLVGVLAAEMPASFEFEALKAQAVAARTYALSRALGLYSENGEAHFGAAVCTTAHCQVWVSEKEYKAGYKNKKEGEKNWEKMKKAVQVTKSIILVYKNKIINPLFHANSGGITEDAENVWTGKSVPYLKSVYSNGEESSPGYEKEYIFTKEKFISKLKKYYPDIVIKEDIKSDIEVTAYTVSNRIKEIRIGNKYLKGTQMRDIFNLNSTNIELEFLGNKIKIITFGYGHGVGMSQYGANALAKKGKDYNYILKYYYSGVELDNMKKYLK